MSGLAVGGLVRGFGASGASGKTSTHTATRPSGSPSATTASGTATVASVATALPTTPFTLTLSVSPHVASAGEQLVVTVLARSVSSNAPVAGLPCTLRAPQNGSQPLLQQWPPAAITNTDGAATWQVSAPSVSGGYEVEVYAQGQHGLYYMYDASVTITG